VLYSTYCVLHAPKGTVLHCTLLYCTYSVPSQRYVVACRRVIEYNIKLNKNLLYAHAAYSMFHVYLHQLSDYQHPRTLNGTVLEVTLPVPLPGAAFAACAREGIAILVRKHIFYLYSIRNACR